MQSFCTLFNIRYLSRGLALYESLKATGISFHLYVFPFDEVTRWALQTLQLEYLTIVPLQSFESPDLLKVKPTRSKGEYCWTCTSFTIDYVLKHYEVPSCTYLDADLYFYSNPSVLLEEMQENAVLITEHRYSPQYDHSKISGKYCVQFMCFYNNAYGHQVLDWWKERCLEWCYARVEPNRFGDQKYLDDWCERFEKVHELKHLGGGLAPWNIQRYKLFEKDNRLYVEEEGQPFPVIFYHFHQLKYMSPENLDFGGYKLDKQIIEKIYKPYVQHLNDIEKRLEALLGPMDIHGIQHAQASLLGQFRRKVLGCYNVFSVKELLYG